MCCVVFVTKPPFPGTPPLAIQREKKKKFTNLLLGREPGLADLVLLAAQLDVEDALHGGEDLLVGRGAALLHLLDDGGRRVALLGQLVLLHRRLAPLPRLLDGVAHRQPHRLRLDDLVRPVHLGVELPDAARAAFGLL